MEKKHIERLYALLKRAKREKGNGYRCRAQMGHTAAGERNGVAKRYPLQLQSNTLR